MEKIRHVGFDLDWTLADYRREALSELAFGLTLERMIERFGYPPAAPDLLLAVFRARFRPWAAGPETAADRAALDDLARRFPVDGGGAAA